MKKYKGLIVLTLFFLLLIEFIDVGVKFIFKLLVDQGTNFSAGSLTRSNFVSFLLLIAVIFVIVEIVRSISNWIHYSAINRLESSAILDLKKKYFNHIIGLSHSFYTGHKTGSLISRLGRGAGAVERMTDVIIFNAAPLIFQLVIALGSLIYFDKVTAMIVAGTLVVFLVWSFIIQRMQEPSNLAANAAEDIEKGNVADIFTNIDSIKYFGKENQIKKKFANLTEKTRAAFLRNWNYYKIMSSGQVFILAIGTFFLIYTSILGVLSGRTTMGTLVFVYTVYAGLLGPLYSFVYGIRNFYRSMADFQDLFEYGKIEPEIKDKEKARECKINSGEISFKNINFDYGKRKIFQNFNLEITPGQKVALVGHSGSGKSTLIKLLYRFYDINSGSISIDKMDITNIRQESLRGAMSIVPQECVLFDDTIYNNVAFSRPEANKREVMRAIKFAQLDKIIDKFPLKEKTIVGERGVKLSGGEKQRVSIARALLADKKVLVLDEATSALDSETEHEIQADLKELMKGRTSIIIAHRLSTIMTADKIVVLKNGTIVQQGTHGELIKQPGEYQHLWNLQKGGYIK